VTDAASKEATKTTSTMGIDRSSEGGLSATVVWQMVRKYWSTALGAALLVSLGATFNTLGQVKIYQAQATILFDPNPPRPLGDRKSVV